MSTLPLDLQPTPYQGFADEYPSLSPLMRLHVRKLYVTGTTTTAQQIADRLSELDPEVIQAHTLLFLEQNQLNPVWQEERKMFLDRQYERMLSDREKITEHIDEVYDAGFFTPLRELVKRKITTYQQSEDGDVHPKDIKTLAETTNLLYQGQRTARNLGNEARKTLSSGPGGEDGIDMPAKNESFVEGKVLAVVEMEVEQQTEETALAPIED